VARLDQDDVLVVTRLDRLARSTRDPLNTLDAISRKGAGFKSLADRWQDLPISWDVERGGVSSSR
jgi:DNA invertase Pin-like site-specific DNA recombinase